MTASHEKPAECHPRFFVISGAPGAGKTTLLHLLKDHHFSVMEEGARFIIQTQSAIGGTALPQKNNPTYAELMLGWELRSYHEAKRLQNPVLFDRGIPDIIAHLALCGLPAPPHLVRAAGQYRYNQTVFIAPYWPEIYRTDTERRQSPGQAQAAYEAILLAYQRLGYTPLVLPKENPARRAQFVINHIKRQEKPGS
ncbi:MAG: AAA family ATPase [Alistipes senegalensis]|nr:AAA family ATPase [Oxalobacter formigenes]MCM1281523.1 AAA family ATPase [Alistipes senegalensis]